MRKVALALLFLIAAVPLAAQTSQNSQLSTTNVFSTPSSFPIQFSIGPQQNGGLGAKVTGSAYWSPNWQLTTKPASGWFVFYLAPEATWSSQDNALNQTSISFRPAFQLVYTNFAKIDLNNPNQNYEIGPFNSVQPMVELYGDIREQYGRFQQNGQVQNVDYTLYGVGGEVQIPYAYRLSNLIQSKTNENRITYAPAIRFTYYQSRDKSSTAQTTPAGIQTDLIDVNIHSQMPFGTYSVNGTKTQLQWNFSFDASRPTNTPAGTDNKWKTLVETSIVFDNGSGFKPVISYTSGSKLGLQYDKQFLLGVAWQFGVTSAKQK
jgi:hypothetical protein